MTTTPATRYDVHAASGLYQSRITLQQAVALTCCDDIEASIEQDGWCGTDIGGVPVVVVEHGDDLADAAYDYLRV